jgi:hypothetical protein
MPSIGQGVRLLVSIKFFKKVLVGLLGVIVTFVPHKLTAQGHETTLVAQDPIVIDVMGGLDWMRCSIGQVWDGDRCSGKTLLIPYTTVDEVIFRIQSNTGDGWRLPTLNELERLVVEQSSPPMIATGIFPDTYQGLYWTSDINWIVRDRWWGVNFYTGHRYGRVTGDQTLAVRLVLDR